MQAGKNTLFIVLAIGCALGLITAPLALMAGFLFTLLTGGVSFVPSKLSGFLLKASVIGLGFGMNMHEVIQTGKDGVALTIVSIAVTISAGFLIARSLHINKKTTHLISSGTAICGGSAIATIAPLIDASDKEISVSMGIVFLLNALALIIFPFLGHYFHLSQHTFGLWCAIAIHDTSSVVGAAAAYGDEALKIATLVKLTRALWIIPVSLLTIFFFRKNGKSFVAPWFIFFYIVAMLLNSYVPVIAQSSHVLVLIAQRLLVVSLFIIGSSLTIAQIKKIGLRPFVLGVALWIIIASGSLLLLTKLGW